MENSHRVLVIDDDRAVLRSIRISLQVNNFVVETASDGLEALERVGDTAYDVILLDLQMPRMDGRTFYRELRSRGISIPVVILSAYGASAARDELGAEGAVNKPFHPDALVSTVRRILSDPVDQDPR